MEHGPHSADEQYAKNTPSRTQGEKRDPAYRDESSSLMTRPGVTLLASARGVGAGTWPWKSATSSEISVSSVLIVVANVFRSDDVCSFVEPLMSTDKDHETGRREQVLLAIGAWSTGCRERPQRSGEDHLRPGAARCSSSSGRGSRRRWSAPLRTRARPAGRRGRDRGRVASASPRSRSRRRTRRRA